jgi:hypothetical protein
MLTKEKLDNLEYKYVKTTEEKILSILWTKYKGSVELQTLLKHFPGMEAKTMCNVHIRKSPFLSYDKKTELVRIHRKGKENPLLFEEPSRASSIGAYCYSLLWKDTDLSFEEVCAKMKVFCREKRLPIGGFCQDKTKHYGYYRKLVNKWKAAEM